MILKVKNNIYPEEGKTVAFINKGKLRIGIIKKPEVGPFYVSEIPTNKKFYPYTQEIIEVGNNSIGVEVEAKVTYIEHE